MGFGVTGLEHVEAGQPDGGAHDVEVAEDPGGGPGVGELELIDQEGGRHPEADEVHQAVELGAEAGAGLGQARHATVQHIENPGEDDEPAGAIEFPASRQHH
jgi:hypothetical protein